MLPPDGWRLEAERYSPASNKAGTPRPSALRSPPTHHPSAGSRTILNYVELQVFRVQCVVASYQTGGPTHACMSLCRYRRHRAYKVSAEKPAVVD